LKDIPDVDSRPDALRAMLRAQIQLKRMDEAKPLATKLATVHGDVSGVSLYSEALIEARQLRRRAEDLRRVRRQDPAQ